MQSKQTCPHDRQASVVEAYGNTGCIDVPDFRPAPLWCQADLQTVRHSIQRPYYSLSQWPGRRIWLPVSGGDALAGTIHGNTRIGRRPLVILIHGLSGCEDSHYLRASARFWLQQGFPVCRLNLRGSAPSRPNCRGLYHAGRYQDLTDALNALKAFEPDTIREGVVPIGFSLGGNMLLKFLAHGESNVNIRAAGTVSAPIDLQATSKRFHESRNRIYHNWLLKRLKTEASAPPANLSHSERRTIEAAATVYQFDDEFVAPHHGFKNARHYYESASGLPDLTSISIPTLLIHAQDDPWIPIKMYREASRHITQNVGIVLPHCGGHVGFHCRNYREAWHNIVLGRFLKKIETQ